MLTDLTLLGFNQGMAQLSLAFFTTVGPSAAIGYALVVLYMLCSGMESSSFRKLDHYLVIPVAVALCGLIVSTNHLGKPANSLFVLMGTGRSPLSNEVLASVVFVGLAWTRWLGGFVGTPESKFGQFTLALAAMFALVQVWFTAHAYNMYTVSTWALPTTQVNQFLAAGMGASVLSIITVASARIEIRRGFFYVCLALGYVTTLAAAVGEIFQWQTISSMESTLYSAGDLVPYYPVLIGISAGIALISLSVTGIYVLNRNKSGICIPILMTIVMFLGIMIARFGFYGMYMTAGL